jgi:hypothetical protein
MAWAAAAAGAQELASHVRADAEIEGAANRISVSM